MTKSIRWRLVAIYIVLVVIVMVVSGTLVVWSTTNSEYETIRSDLTAAADILERSIGDAKSVEAAEQDLKAVINEFGDTYNDKIVYLLNSEGEIIYPSNTKSDLYYAQVKAAISGEDIKELDNVTLEGEAYNHKGYARPIMVDGSVSYVVYIMTSTETVETTIGKIIEIILYAVVIAIVIATILGFIFSNYITKPISLLSNRARLMAEGDLQTSIEVQSHDEIGQLTRDFNIMATSLSETMGEINSEKNKLEIVFSQITDGILVFDGSGNLNRYNPTAEKMLHVKLDDKFDDIFAFYIEETFDEIIKTIKSDITQHVIKKADRYYNITFATFVGQSESTGMISVIQDITEHKKLELMQKEFVANVSHELRTPLTTIKSYAETLIDGAITEEEIAMKFLGVINHEGDRMTALVQDLLELSKLDNKQTKFTMEQLDLNQLVMDSIEKYQIHAEKKRQILTFHKPKHNYNIYGDIYRVEQVLKNIISNAIKYSPEEALVNVTITEDIKMINVVIEDTGFGISEQDLERIFDRFYRVDKARSREMGGTGLGLAIAKEIMEYHGGNISVDSILGEGTTFYLSFPKQFKEQQT